MTRQTMGNGSSSDKRVSASMHTTHCRKGKAFEYNELPCILASADDLYKSAQLLNGDDTKGSTPQIDLCAHVKVTKTTIQANQ